MFSEIHLKEDLLFYQDKLKKHHPNFYLYSTKERVDNFFDSLLYSINRPMREEEFYQIISLTSEIIKDGHTIILPSGGFTEYHNANSKFLPLQIGIKDTTLYIKMNCTTSKQLDDGTIVDSINGTSSRAIIQHLLSRQVRDGNNLSYSRWILDTYFREYYSYHFGHPETHKISYKQNSDSYIIELPGLPKDSINYYRQKNYPDVYSTPSNNKAIYLNYNTTKLIAILTIKDFHTDILKKEYQQNFKKEIKTILEEVIESNTKNLVIDLRNNQGGDVQNGVYLLKYLLKRPFKVVNEYQKLKNEKLVPDKGPSIGIHKPFKKQYTGQIYVLLNGGSFSNSVIFSSCLKENTNTIFAGSESGGNPNVLAGYSKDFELPNTKINVQVPTKRFIMTSLNRNNGSGLIPTYKIEANTNSHMHQNDSQLDILLDLIRQKENNGR